MTTDSNDSTDPSSGQQALVKRLARTATSALETDDKSLHDTVSSLSNTVADRVSARTQDEPAVRDHAWLEVVVGEVTRQVAVEKAARLEQALYRGLDEPEGTVEPVAGPVDDGVFEAARRRFIQCCVMARNGLDAAEFYLFKRHLLEGATWSELAEEFHEFDASGQPNHDVMLGRLATGLDQLRSRLEKDSRTAAAEAPAQDAATAETVPTASESDDLELEETLLTWGLTERQQYLASRSLPWVTLRAVNGTPPDLPLKEPLLVNAANSDAFLEWAEDAEFNGKPAEPVVIMLEEDHDSLPARFWSYSHGTVSPNDWTRAEDLLACNRLLESESAALSVELEEIPEDADTLMWRVSQFAFDSEVTAELQEHLTECVTCRVAFNAFLEKRLAVWRANVADIAPATEAATVSEVATASDAATASLGEPVTTSETATASAPGGVSLPEELTRPEWTESLPSDARPVWSLVLLTARFVGAEPVRALLEELKQRNAARPEVLMSVFPRMLAEMRRRAARPRPPGLSLASYAAESARQALRTEPSATGPEPDVGGAAGGFFSSLIQMTLSGGVLAGFAGAVDPTDAPGWRDSTERFLDELQQGIPAQADGLSFTVQLDGDTAELVLHTMKDATGTTVPTFQLEWLRDGETLHRAKSDSGGLRLKLDDLTRLPADELTLLRIQRA